MNNRKHIVVLISGGGSNLQALIDACDSSDYPAQIIGVISNKANAYGLERAKQANIPTSILSHKDFANRESFDEALHQTIMSFNPDFVCLAGFMRLLTSDFVKKWTGRMINIHPSLLPKYKGLNTHQRAIDAGEKQAGCTVHFVVPEMDAGKIIKQASVEISSTDTADTLAKKVLEQEHKIYPEALKILVNNN